jgi:hypothetical protein
MKINLKQMTAAALTALLFAAGTASAGDDHDYITEWSDDSRYQFSLDEDDQMIFKNPVSFTGEVVASELGHRTLRAANGMLIKVPIQALRWNGDRELFNQSTNVGDEVVVHMREEEGYRLMQAPAVNDPWLAIGSYDGVFYFPKDFVRDFALDDLDDDIYADLDDDYYDDDRDITYVDEDDTVVVVDEDLDDNEASVYTVDDDAYNDMDDDELYYDNNRIYDIDLESVR